MKPVFGVLGPLLTPAGPIGATKHRILLASLLVRAGEVVSVEELTGHLWEAEPPGQPRATIQTYIRRLRQVLGASLIETSARGYRVTVSPDEVDLFRFHELIRAASTAMPPQRAQLLAEALGLWRGQVFADVPSAALRETHGVRLAEERVRAMEQRFDAELELGHSGDLVADLRAATTESPLHEEFWAQLMLALYRADRQAEALEAFTEAGRVLTSELGTKPGTRLRELHQKILTADAALAPPKPSRPSVIPSQLPLDIPDFVGRVAPCARITGLLSGPTPIVISGSPGIGKTALAVHVGHAVRDQFPDGQLYINLRGFAIGSPLSPVQVLSQFLRSLGVPPEQIPVERSAMAERYQRELAGRSVLVVLDNAVSSEQLRELLPQSERCAVLITSRFKLDDLPESHQIFLGALSPSEAHTLLASILSHLTNEQDFDTQTINELASLCAYLPLALRIAAANVSTSLRGDLTNQVSDLYVEDLLSMLQVTGDQQAAVRATFDLSYHKLDASTQELFRHLGAFPGPEFDTAVGAALLNTSTTSVRPLFARLTDGNLIQEFGPHRYQFHDLMRLYAAELLDRLDTDEQRKQALDRLVDFYLSSLWRANKILWPEALILPKEQLPKSAHKVTFSSAKAARQWLEAQRHNIVSIATQLDLSSRPEATWQFADLTRRYLQNSMYLIELKSIANRGLEAATAAGNDDAEAAMLYILGLNDYYADDYQSAKSLIKKSIEKFAGRGNTPGTGFAKNTLGTIYTREGRILEAAQQYAASVQFHRDNGQIANSGIPLTNLSNAYCHLGRLEQAALLYQEGIAIAQKNRSEYLEMLCSTNLGHVYGSLGRFQDSWALLREPDETSKRIGGRSHEFNGYDELAIIYRETGNLSQALHYAEAGFSVTVNHGLNSQEAKSRTTLGTIYLRLREPQKAKEQFQTALAISGRYSYTEAEILARIGMSLVQLQEMLTQESLTSSGTAYELARRTGFRILQAQALLAHSQARLALGQYGKAVSLATTSLLICRQTGHRPGEARALATLASSRAASGHPEQAAQLRAEALRLFTAMGMPEADELRPQT